MAGSNNTNNFQSINTFTKGMNLDTMIPLVSNDSYIYAENVRVVVDNISNTGSLHAIEGLANLTEDGLKYKYYEYNELYDTIDELYADFSTSKFKIIGIGIIRDYVCVFTRDLNEPTYNYIFRLLIKNNIPELTMLVSGEFNIGGEDQNQISITTRWEDFDNIKVYWTDGFNPLRYINISEDNDLNNYNKDVDYFSSSKSVILFQPQFNNFVSGSLKAGLIQYAFQLFSKNGSETAISPLSQMIHLTSSRIGDLNYQGSNEGDSSGKSVRIKFRINDSGFDECRVYSIHYVNGTDNPTIKIVSEFELSLNEEVSGNYQYFTDSGSYLSEIPYQEFVSLEPYYIIPKVIESKNDWLFCGNIIEDNWVLPSYEDDDWYDTRSFRFGWSSLNGIHSIIKSNSGEEKLIKPEHFTNLSDKEWREFIPGTHDCINPTNELTFSDIRFGNDKYIYTKDNQNNIPYRIGGSGRNVDFKIVYTKFGEDYYSQVTNDDYNNKLNNEFRGHVREVNINNISNKTDDKLEINYEVKDILDNSIDYIYNTNTDFNKLGPINYSNPVLSNKFRSYQRDELYRFGVIFYNEKGQTTPVNWIADILMPPITYKGSRLFDQWGRVRYNINDYSNQDLYQIVTHPMGVQFTFRNLPSYVRQIEIVRAQRTYDDRSILSQGLIGKCARESSGSNLSRPLNSMTYSDYYDTFHWNASNTWNKSHIWVSYTGNLVSESNPTVPYIFASSEVSYFGDSMNEYWDNLEGLNVLYGLCSPTQPTWDGTSPSNQSEGYRRSQRRAFENGLFVYNNDYWYDGGNGNFPSNVFWTSGNYDGDAGQNGTFAMDAFMNGGVRKSKAYIGDFTIDSDGGGIRPEVDYGEYSLWTSGSNFHHPDGDHPVTKVRLVGKMYNPFTFYTGTNKNLRIDAKEGSNFIRINSSKLATNISYDDYDAVNDKQFIQSVDTEVFQNWTPNKTFNEPSRWNEYIEENSHKGNAKNVKNGSHGPCIFFVAPEFITKIPSINRLGNISDRYFNSDYFNSANLRHEDKSWNIWDTSTIEQRNRGTVLNSTFLVNLRKSTVPYGGLDYNSRLSTNYISTTFVQEVDNDIADMTIFGGDTFIGINEYIVQHWYMSKRDPFGRPGNASEGVEEDNRGQKAQIVVYYPSESSINLSLVNGSNFFRYANNKIYPHELWLEPGTRDSGFTQSNTLYKYNSAYSREPDAKIFVSRSRFAEDNKNIDFRIMHSDPKTNDEITDSWLKFRPANYLDLDTRFGSVNNMKLFNNNLYYWQDDAFGILSVNQRSIITDNNFGSLVLGTGGALERYDYISMSNGSKKDVLNNNVTTPSTMFWYDHDRGELLSFSDQLTPLSKVKTIQSFFNKNKDNFSDEIVTLYDKKYSDVHFMFNMLDKSYNHLIYNEQVNAFSSFYTYDPDWFIDLKDNYYTFKNNNIHKLNSSTYNNFYNGIDNTKVTNLINENQIYTKIFDNVETTGNIELNDDFYAEYKTKTQDSLRITKDDVKLREDNYRFIVPRSTNIITTESELFPNYNDRLRGKYLISTYNFKPLNSDLDIPYIKTSYRISMI